MSRGTKDVCVCVCVCVQLIDWIEMPCWLNAFLTPSSHRFSFERLYYTSHHLTRAEATAYLNASRIFQGQA